MFKIKLSPQSNTGISYKHTVITINGAVINYDGTDYDFSLLPDNCQVEAEFPAIGTINKTNGLISITLLYVYDSSLAETYQSTNELDYEFYVEEGEVPCPITWKPEPEPEPEQVGSPVVAEEEGELDV